MLESIAGQRSCGNDRRHGCIHVNILLTAHSDKGIAGNLLRDEHAELVSVHRECLACWQPALISTGHHGRSQRPQLGLEEAPCILEGV